MCYDSSVDCIANVARNLRALYPSKTARAIARLAVYAVTGGYDKEDVDGCARMIRVRDSQRKRLVDIQRQRTLAYRILVKLQDRERILERCQF